MVVRIKWLLVIRGWKRIRRKMPATTIVLEWRRAETGVGPSIAEGSQGWRLNWADLPVAAISKPIRGIVSGLLRIKIWGSSQELELRQNQAIARIKPMSPIRLYRMA